MKDECIFCKIIAGEIPSYKIYETDNFLSFLDISQFVPGHTLVIPKEHSRFVWDVPKFTEYYQVINKIANHYKNDLKYTFVDSLVFGRGVAHAHVHLLPHNGDDKDWENALKCLEF